MIFDKFILHPGEYYIEEIIEVAKRQQVLLKPAILYHHLKKGTFPNNWVIIERNKYKIKIYETDRRTKNPIQEKRVTNTKWNPNA